MCALSVTGFEDLSSAAVSNLQQHSVNMLKLCWRHNSPDAARTAKVFHRLLPTAGWPLPLLASASAGSGQGLSNASWVPVPSQQAELAHVLLQMVRVKALLLLPYV